VLADLWLAGRITDGAESLEIDTESTGIRYLDIAIEVVDGGSSEPQWIARGRLRASDVAAELVAGVGGRSHGCPAGPRPQRRPAEADRQVAYPTHGVAARPAGVRRGCICR